MPKTKLTDTQKLAEELHDRLCHRSHNDDCEWGYVENPWDDLEGLTARGYTVFKNYLDRAEALLATCGSYEKARAAIKATFGF